MIKIFQRLTKEEKIELFNLFNIDNSEINDIDKFLENRFESIDHFYKALLDSNMIYEKKLFIGYVLGDFVGFSQNNKLNDQLINLIPTYITDNKLNDQIMTGFANGLVRFRTKKYIISVHPEVLKWSKLKIDEINEIFVELRTVLKDNFQKLFENNKNIGNGTDESCKVIYIDNIAILKSLMFINKNLKILYKCQGFEKYIERYSDEKQFWHNYFVAALAGSLVSKVGFNNIILEPNIENYENEHKNPDICIKLNDVDTIIECKIIDSEKIFYYSEEHSRLAKLLSKWLIEIPCNYELQLIYKDSFSDIDVYQLCKRLNNIIPLITGEGEILNDYLFKVEIIKNLDEDNVSEIRFLKNEKLLKYRYISELKGGEQMRVYKSDIEDHTTIIGGTMLIIPENYIYPQSTFLGKNVLFILGPKKVDYTSIIENEIKKARKQAPKNKPYVLAINMTTELGSIEINREILKSLFQPGRNSRYSGILLIKLCIDEFNFEFIRNPFNNELASKEFNSISDKFNILFK